MLRENMTELNKLVFEMRKLKGVRKKLARMLRLGESCLQD